MRNQWLDQRLSGRGNQNHHSSLGERQINIPSRARPNTQTGQKDRDQYLRRICPPTVRMTINPGHGGEPYFVSPQSAHAQAALRALKAAFGYEPIAIREGGSIPIITDLKKILGAEALMLGLALPDANAHSPNEKFSLDAFSKGMRMSAYLWEELVRT